MPFDIVRNDITKMKVDIIVNAANSSLLGGGGVDGAIHKAAGPELLNECKQLNGCETGNAKITKGYLLDAKYVIHTVGPLYKDGKQGEEALLRNCFKNSFQLALDVDAKSIAFPLISSGVYGYPKQEAMYVALSEISQFLLEHEMDIYLVIFDKESLRQSSTIFNDVAEYIDDHYVDDKLKKERSFRRVRYQSVERLQSEVSFETIEDRLAGIDETFKESLFRLIDERGFDDPYIYKKVTLIVNFSQKLRVLKIMFQRRLRLSHSF
jgi:O-acetyl-ADP-ribose deacetylase (regulator of RNase III)